MTGVILDYLATIVTVHGSLLTFISLRPSVYLLSFKDALIF
jgi:hypothetical protein